MTTASSRWNCWSTGPARGPSQRGRATSPLAADASSPFELLRRPGPGAAFLALAVGFVALTATRQGATLRGAALVPIVVALAAIIVIDARLMLVPNLITVPGLAYTILFAFVLDGRDAGSVAAGVLAGGGVALALALISRGGIGGGDVKLLAMLGPALGWTDVLGTFVASQFVALLVVLVVSLARRRLVRDPVPVGAIIAALAALLLAGTPPQS